MPSAHTMLQTSNDSSNNNNNNMNSLVRDTLSGQLQQNGRAGQHMGSSQTSLQKLQNSSSPQFLYSINPATAAPAATNHLQHHHQSPPQSMQFPPPPPPPPSIAGGSIINPAAAQMQHQQMTKGQLQQQQQDESTFINSSLIVPPPQSQQLLNQHQQHIVNGIPGYAAAGQPTIMMSPMMAAKNTQNHQQQQYISQQQQYQSQMNHQIAQHQQQQQQQQHHQQQQQQQQVPMTTIMIPASAAAQIQSASMQIQQAVMQSMVSNPNQPQILVFMIPYLVGPNQQQQPPNIPPTPDQSSLNSTLVRQSIMRASANQHHNPTQAHQVQQLQQQHHPIHHHHQHQASITSHSRAVSSLSQATTTLTATKQESEKFYVKANFSFQATRNNQPKELSFKKGDILHVLDTLQNSDYSHQYWLATRVKSNGKDADKGLIPDKGRAEELALEQRRKEMDLGGELGASVGDGSSGGAGGVLSASVGRVNFLRRRSAQRSKSLCKDNWDNVVFDIGSFKLPPYERVVYKHPGFCRPVVIFGPLADVAREKLLKDYPEKYSYPTGFNQAPQGHPRVIRMKGILEVIDQGKHALLDITPPAVEKLNHVNLTPIVIFMKTDSKSIIKEFRQRALKSLDPNAKDEDTLRRDGGSSSSSRKLLEQSIKLEKMWSHVFTATLNLSTMGSEMWYRKLRETIENQQSANVWMSEKKTSSSDKTSRSAANLSGLAAAAASATTTASINGDQSNNNNVNLNEMMFQMASSQSMPVVAGSATAAMATTNGNSSQPSGSFMGIDAPHGGGGALSDRFSESLNITSKSTIDLLPGGTYGNRSQLRNAYAHILAQKLARASSEPKLNGMMSDEDDDDEDDDDDGNLSDIRRLQHGDDDDDDEDDEIIKKPFPSEFENSSSVSSSNGGGGGGATSYGQSSSTMQPLYQTQQQSQLHSSAINHHQQQQQQPIVVKSDQMMSRLQQQESIYSRNPTVQQQHQQHQQGNNGLAANNNGTGQSNSYSNGSRSDYHHLPPVNSHGENGYGNSPNSHNIGGGVQHNSVIDLARNHEARGSAFQVYSDINQNNYHYYNLNKI